MAGPNPIPLLALGAGALLLMRGRGVGEVSADHCEELRGIWHEATGGDMPITIAGYRKAYSHIQLRMEESNWEADKDELVMETLEGLAPHCPWDDPEQYSDRMKDVQSSVDRIFDQIQERGEGGVRFGIAPIVWGIGALIIAAGAGTAIATAEPGVHEFTAEDGAPPPSDDTSWSEDLDHKCEAGFTSHCNCDDVIDWLTTYKNTLKQIKIAADDLQRFSGQDGDEEAQGLIAQADSLASNFYKEYGVDYLKYDCDPGWGITDSGSKAYNQIRYKIVPAIRRAREFENKIAQAVKKRMGPGDHMNYAGEFAEYVTGMSPGGKAALVGGGLLLAYVAYKQMQKKGGNGAGVAALPAAAPSSGRLKLP